MQIVGGGYEKDLGKIIIKVEVVVIEGKILLGIQHFEQCGRRISSEVHTHLVDFIQAEDRDCCSFPSSGSE